MPVQITEWSDAFLTSLASAMVLFFSAIPKILGFLLIVIVGWLLASLIDKGVTALLRRIGFNQLATRAGLADFVAKMGLDTDAAGVIGLLLRWLVRIVALVVAFDALGLPAVSEVVRQLLLWLPNVIVALAILVIGGLAARGLGNVVRGAASEAGLSNAHFLSKVASVVVWVFAIVVAIHQIGVATELVNALFIAVVGALALGLGLAFGLGGRETAAQIVNKWYARAQEKSAELAQARRDADVNDSLTGQAGSWPTGGYPGPAPANRKHTAEGG